VKAVWRIIFDSTSAHFGEDVQAVAEQLDADIEEILNS
jgi:hypothetical protein